MSCVHACLFHLRRLLQIEAESKRIHALPSQMLNPNDKDAIMRQKYIATMKPVSIYSCCVCECVHVSHGHSYANVLAFEFVCISCV